MKIRSGFVSNSSSSSFVVAIPKSLLVPSDIKTAMFGDEVSLYGPYDDDQQHSFDVNEVVGVITREIESQTPNSIKAIAEELDGYDPQYGDANVEGLTDGIPDVEDYNWEEIDKLSQKEKEKFWDNRAKLSEARGRALAKRFIDANKNCDVYVFEFSDNNGSMFSMMEHGDIFRNFKHVRISKH